VEFSTKEEFEFHVHKCFNIIFENLLKVDAVVKEKAEKEEAEGAYGTMCDLRDYIEVVILHCHLAWQYHRLSRMGSSSAARTWDRLETESKDGEGQVQEK
jgi:hypothetical protein